MTFSPNKIKANKTETGNSKEDRILPKPKPTFGNPKLNSIGGKIVPKTAKNNPYFQKIDTLKTSFGSSFRLFKD